MNNKGYFDLMDYFPLFLFGSLFIVGIILVSCAWVASGVNAKIYNDKFGTHYTQAEFFWCQTTIRSFVEGGEQKTQNININGYLPLKVIE